MQKKDIIIKLSPELQEYMLGLIPENNIPKTTGDWQALVEEVLFEYFN